MDTEKCDNIVDFALEVLHGCKSACYGCNVNTTDQQGFIAGDIPKLDGLFTDLLSKDFILANLSVGPTDFFMASNTEEMLDTISPLMDKFKSIVIQSTFIYPKEEMEKQAAMIAPYLKGRRVKLGFPVDPRHLDKAKYVETIIDNIKYFKNLIPEVDVIKIFAVLNLKYYKDASMDPIFNVGETVKLFRRNKIDFDAVLTEGRLDMSDINNKEKLKQSFLYVKRIHDQQVFPHDIYELLTLSTYYREAVQLHSIDSQGRRFKDIDFVYKNGKIYNTVFSGEAVTLFHDSLSIDNAVVWDTDALLGLRNRILVEQIEYMEKTKDCSNCEFVSSCMEKGFLQVMKIAGTKQCIVSKQTFEDNRNTLHNTYRKCDYEKMFHEQNHPDPTPKVETVEG